MAEENKEVKQQLEEATSKAESLQCELLKTNKTNILLKLKTDDYDIADERFQESLTKKTNQFRVQAAVEKFVEYLQVMEVEIDFQRAEAILLIQIVDGKQYEISKNVCMPSSPMATTEIGKTTRNTPFSMSNVVT